MIDWLEKAIDFSNTLNASIAASWLILVVIGLRLVLKKAPKWVNVALWGIVALRLLMPFSIESVFSLIPSEQTVSDHILQAGPVPGSASAYLDIVTNPSYGNTVSVELDSSISTFQWDLLEMNVIWIVGMAIMTAYTAVSYLTLRRKLRTAVILKENIFQCEAVHSPFVLGILKPRIYLPYSIDGQNLQHVVAHERSHIRRKDHWWKPLGFLLLTIHWFNPLMWFAYILLCRDIELACDEKVISELGNEQRADYTQALVACSVNRRLIAACPLAFGEVGVKERVRSIMNYRKPTFWIIVAALVICVIVAVCFLTNPTPSPEFAMSGDNVYHLDVDTIMDRIFSYEDVSNSNVYMNANNFSLMVDSDFNWVDSQAIRYFFWDNHKTQSAQLRIFPDEGKYFLTESEKWMEQDRIFLLRYYLEALKYLPQDAIRQMAPADQYIIQHIDGGRPSDYDRVISYSSQGVGETEGWYLHLQIQPLHEDGEGYSGTGEEVVELFYGDKKGSNAVKPYESKLFANADQDRITVVPSVLDLENAITQNGDILILQNEGGLWHFTEGQEVDVSIIFENDGSSMSMKAVGFIFCGSGNEGLYAQEIFSNQTVTQSNGGFTAPKTGNYLFYFNNTSASWIQLTDFSVTTAMRFDGSLTDANKLVIQHSDAATGQSTEKYMEDPQMIATILSMYESLELKEYSRPLSEERMKIQFFYDDLLVEEWYVSYYEEDNIVVTSCDAFGLGNRMVLNDFSYDSLLELFRQSNVQMIPTDTQLQGLHAGALLLPIGDQIYRYMLTAFDPVGLTIDELLCTFAEPDIYEVIDWEVYSLKEYPDKTSVLMISETRGACLYTYSPPSRCSDTALEDAVQAGYVVMEDGIATHGQEIWKEFYDSTQQGNVASVTVARYGTLDPKRCDSVFYEIFNQDYPYLNVYQLSYDGKFFTLTIRDRNEVYTRTYEYLMKYDTTTIYSMSAKIPGGRYDYVLTNDNQVTWEQIWDGLVSSYTGDDIDHDSIYSERKE